MSSGDTSTVSDLDRVSPTVILPRLAVGWPRRVVVVVVGEVHCGP